MLKAMENAGITPDCVDYVNVHGTGTEANDRIETMAMKRFSPCGGPAGKLDQILFWPQYRRGRYCGINCLSGDAAAEKVLPTLNFTLPRPNCDLDYVANEFREKMSTSS